MIDITTKLLVMDRVGMRELRQNPAPVLRAVEKGAEVTVAVNGRPVARIVPYETPAWVDGERASRIYTAPVDAGWEAELAAIREDETLADPWQ
ncbi:MAG: type II toxin-antitoxin system prevent-host-death family antitoxin [Mycobacterium sp.]|uniref:type II toxin-antitoxin system Phd/YefM family antitoxin n=1 Tax=Mycobacterium sp. TaxID=1785 RepID=UPI001ED732F1|nr:type II toxin-antitoxin system prevent-host-death family antitoxin [Mycobacterium sp.]MBW0019368.1 type II toxin-antitoxin system prevent-host-death family antitoxin [Mycobacterium sp.]